MTDDTPARISDTVLREQLLKVGETAARLAFRPECGELAVCVVELVAIFRKHLETGER